MRHIERIITKGCRVMVLADHLDQTERGLVGIVTDITKDFIGVEIEVDYDGGGFDYKVFDREDVHAF